MITNHVKMTSAFENQDVDEACKIMQEHFGLNCDKVATSINRSRFLKKSEVGFFTAGNLYLWDYDNGFTHLAVESYPVDDNATARCVLLIKEAA
jgi:hypothetical protein